jgi:hypothetical protein
MATDKPKRYVAADILLTEIMGYESDTFSATGAEMTQAEGDAVVATFIELIMNRMDGDKLDECLGDLREGDGDNG